MEIGGGYWLTYRNLLVTFLIGGLWHGAGWTFIFWGFLHGIALVVHRVWQNLGFRLNKVLAWFITFNFINLTWIFFRAKEWEDAIKVLKGMLGMSGIILPSALANKFEFINKFGVEFGRIFVNIWGGDALEIVAWLFIYFLLVLFFKNSMEYKKEFYLKSLRYTFYSIGLIFYSFYARNTYTEFLYFNF